MIKGFYLSTCSTCQKIIAQIKLPKAVELQDIKTNQIRSEQLEEMKNLSGSYESLFSRKAIKYRSMNLKEKNLSESDYKKLILEEYTFLKRPVFIVDNQIYIGNSKKNVAALKEHLEKLEN